METLLNILKEVGITEIRPNFEFKDGRTLALRGMSLQTLDFKESNELSEVIAEGVCTLKEIYFILDDVRYCANLKAKEITKHKDTDKIQTDKLIDSIKKYNDGWTYVAK